MTKQERIEAFNAKYEHLCLRFSLVEDVLIGDDVYIHLLDIDTYVTFLTEAKEIMVQDD